MKVITKLAKFVSIINNLPKNLYYFYTSQHLPDDFFG